MILQFLAFSTFLFFNFWMQPILGSGREVGLIASAVSFRGC